MRRLAAAAVVVIAVATLALAGGVTAATDTQIAILDNRYDPQNVNVALDPRDGIARVTWTNIGKVEHTVTSKTGAWADKGPLPPDGRGKFVVDVQRPGTFLYFCTIHGEAVMSGTLMVTGSGPPPATTTVPPTTASTVPETTTTTESTTTTTEPVTTTTTEETTTSSSSTTSTTAVALRDDDDDDDESNGPLRIVGVGALLAAAAGTVVQARRFFAGV